MDSRWAVVLIDIQNFQQGRELGPYGLDEVVSNANELIKAGRDADGLVVYVRNSHLPSGGDALRVVADNRPSHGTRFEGWDSFVDELIPPRELEEPVTIKRGWDAFYGSSLELQLRRHGVGTIVLSGVSTNFGVEGTARAAIDRGFNVVFAEDAMSSADAELHHFAVSRIFPRIGRVMSTSQAVTALRGQLRQAG